jgi:hypothetical protein
MVKAVLNRAAMTLGRPLVRVPAPAPSGPENFHQRTAQAFCGAPKLLSHAPPRKTELPMLPTDSKRQFWSEWHDMLFWLWACRTDANSYLDAERHEYGAVMHVVANARGETVGNFDTLRAGATEAKKIAQLARYHFVSTLGKTIRTLNRVAQTIPDIEPACIAAEHFFKEGRICAT